MNWVMIIFLHTVQKLTLNVRLVFLKLCLCENTSETVDIFPCRIIPHRLQTVKIPKVRIS